MCLLLSLLIFSLGDTFFVDFRVFLIYFKVHSDYQILTLQNVFSHHIICLLALLLMPFA